MTMHNTSPLPYEARRQRLAQAIGPHAVALIANPGESTRSHDTTHPYRASSDLLYLCGFSEPHAVLLLAPGHDEGDFHLFVPEKDPLREQWDGYRAGPEGAERDFGADKGHPLSQLDELLPKLLQGRDTLYFTLGQDAEVERKVLHTLDKLSKRHRPFPASPTRLQDLRPTLHAMRAVKDELELERLRIAAQLSSEAHKLAMRATRPGLYEFQLQALIEFHFASRGANAPAYATIVGSGKNTNTIHYITNREQLHSGDLVLVDAGCEYDHYAADITRTWPVDGTFSPAQRDLYEGVLSIQQTLITACATRPTFEELTRLTAKASVEILRDLKILHGDTDELLEKNAHKPYAPHGFGHWLGLDVHDVPPYYDAQGASLPLHVGAVLTIEPGLYLPTEDDAVPAALRGLGVRIEDDILITESGIENLTESCPKTIDQIEALVGQGLSLSL